MFPKAAALKVKTKLTKGEKNQRPPGKLRDTADVPQMSQRRLGGRCTMNVDELTKHKEKRKSGSSDL